MKKHIFTVIVAVLFAMSPFAMEKEGIVTQRLSLPTLPPGDEISISNTKIIQQQEACTIKGNDEKYIAATLGVGPYHPSVCINP